MTYYQEPYSTIYYGDCREVLAGLPAESVQCVVTSPPYWGLRKYSGEQELIWGGDRNCQHQWVSEKQYHGDPVFLGKTRWQHDKGGSTAKTPEIYEGGGKTSERYLLQTFCSLCGAWKGSYGLEPTLEMYIDHTIEILRAIRRVLRKDGVVFWNIGDTYMSHPAISKSVGGFDGKQIDARPDYKDTIIIGKRGKQSILKNKDLCLMPSRVAIAAQEDGWWIRRDIIWNKPNPKPESVTDRPTTSHDYILMLTKSDDYYWDADAVREPSLIQGTSFGSDQRDTRETHGMGGGDTGLNEAKRRAKEAGGFGGRNIRSVWTFPTEASGLEMCLKCKTVYDSAVYQRLPSKVRGKTPSEVAIEHGYDPESICPVCGRSWKRHASPNAADRQAGLRREFIPCTTEARDRPLVAPHHPYRGDGWGEEAIEGRDAERKVKVCRCGASDWLSHFAVFPEKLPEICIKAASKPDDLVLDPLAGSGRVGKVAKDLGRKAILIDTSEDYCRMAKRRIEVVPLPMIFPVEETYPKAPDWF